MNITPINSSQYNNKMPKNNTSFGMKVVLDRAALGEVVDAMVTSSIDKRDTMQRAIAAINDVNSSIVDKIFLKAMGKAKVREGVGHRDLIPDYDHRELFLDTKTKFASKDSDGEYHHIFAVIENHDAENRKWGSTTFNKKAEENASFIKLFKELPLIGSKYKRLTIEALRKYANVAVEKAWAQKLEDEAEAEFRKLCEHP